MHLCDGEVPDAARRTGRSVLHGLRRSQTGSGRHVRDVSRLRTYLRAISTRSAIAKALGREAQDQRQNPVAGLDVDILPDLTESSYIQLVRWTGLQAHPNKRGRLSAAEEASPEGLWTVTKHPHEWIRRLQGAESRIYRAIGSAEIVGVLVFRGFSLVFSISAPQDRHWHRRTGCHSRVRGSGR